MSSAIATPAAGVAATPGSWRPVFSLSLGIFAIVMSEFLPASLLPRMAEGLHISEGQAGQAVSVTAFSAALAALLVAVVLPRTDRRRVMLGLTLLAVLSNLVVAVAPNLTVLLLGRVLVGVALGGFWAMATAMAAHLVRPDQVGRALTVINSGVAAATVTAVPVGAWVGDTWGWRGTFLLGAGVGLLALLAQASTLPSIAPAPGGGLHGLGVVLRSGIVLAGLSAVLLVFGGHFGGFTYIRPAVASPADLDGTGFAGLLLLFGLAGFAGTAASGPVADRVPRLGAALFPGILGVGMVVLLTAGATQVGLLAGVALWGFGFGGVPTTVMSWGARIAPAHLEQVGGVLVTACNLAIAVGAALGGALVDNVGAATPLLVGGLAALAGAALLTSLRQLA